jgi:hypothetical protein
VQKQTGSTAAAVVAAVLDNRGWRVLWDAATAAPATCHPLQSIAACLLPRVGKGGLEGLVCHPPLLSDTPLAMCVVCCAPPDRR